MKPITLLAAPGVLAVTPAFGARTAYAGHGSDDAGAAHARVPHRGGQKEPGDVRDRRHHHRHGVDDHGQHHRHDG